MGLWQQLQPYQQNRLLSFLNPEIDPRATGWHIIQSKIAIGSGGLLGKGFTDGTQKRLAFLPAQHTDFIYSVIAEEQGFMGSVIVLVLFLLLLALCLQTAFMAPDKMGRLLCVGVAVMIFCHAFINIGMTVGVMPITGLPLPLLSYGGSFMMAIMSALGIVQSVHLRSHRTRIPVSGSFTGGPAARA